MVIPLLANQDLTPMLAWCCIIIMVASFDKKKKKFNFTYGFEMSSAMVGRPDFTADELKIECRTGSEKQKLYSNWPKRALKNLEMK